MVDGRSLVDLILVPGSQARAYGHLETNAAGEVVLWAPFPWEPTRWPYRTAGGDIPLRFADPLGADLPAGVVQVDGTWTGAALSQAVVEQVDFAQVAFWSAEPGELSPDELGAERFVAISSMLADASRAPHLGGGGTDEAMWEYVLYVTPELVAAHQGLPVRADVYAAIAPA